MYFLFLYVATLRTVLSDCSSYGSATGCNSWTPPSGPCGSCWGGFWLNSYGQCWPNNCATCSDYEGVCTLCHAPYYAYDGKCYDPCPTTTFASGTVCAACPSNCDTCSDTNTCTVCSSGWKLYQGQCYDPCPVTTYTLGTDCLDCGPHCDTCSDSSTCTACSSGYYMYLSACYNPCPTTTFISGSICAACGSNCDVCSSSSICTTCSSGFYLYNGACYNPCPTTTYVSGSNCANCPSNCDSCSSSSVCTVCSSGWKLYQGQCYNPCPVTTYTSGVICQDCSSHCDTCSDSSTCTACSSGYYMHLSACYNPCPTTTFISGSICAACGGNCDACSDSSTCTGCSSGYYMYNSACYNPCPTTTFISGSICAACGSNCDVCSSSSVCTTCSSGYYLYNDQCYNPCPTKTFTSGSNCANCPSNCDVCSSSSVCTTCGSGFYLYNGLCYNPCPTKTYVSGSNCADCPSNCDSCSSSSVCTACSSGWKLYQGQCYNPCPVTTFTSGVTCQDCSSHCDTCSDSSICTACSSTWKLYQSQCHNPCPVTTFAYGSICRDCPSHCDVCNDENTCTACSSGYKLYRAQCYGTCPVTTYTLGTNCLDCGNYCDVCVDSSTCTVCTSGYYFYQSKCYVKCPSQAPYLSPTVSPYTCFQTCPTATPYSYQNLCYTNCPAEAPYLIDNICYTKSLIAKAAEMGDFAASTASTILIARSVASFSNPSLFMFGSLMKLLEYTRYMNISHSDGLEVLFQTIGDSSDLIPMPSMSDEMQNAFETHPMPDVFARYDFPSNFMLNEGDDILAFLTILSLFGIFWIMYRGVLYLRNMKNTRSLVTNARFFFQNYVIGKFYEMLGDVTLAAVFEFKTFSSSDRYSWLSLTACISCLILGVMLYAVNFWLIYAHQKRKRDDIKALKEFSEKYKGAEILFDSFKDESFLHQAAMIFFVARNIISSQVIALAYSLPLFQSAVLLVLSFFMVVYYLLLRPMKSRLEFVEQVSFEVLLFAVNGCFFIQAMCDTMQASTEAVVNSIGQMVIMLNIVFKFLPLIFLAVQLGLLLWKYYSLIKHALKLEETEKNKGNMILTSSILEPSDSSFTGLRNLTLDESMIVSQISRSRLDILRNRRVRKLALADGGLKKKTSKSRTEKLFSGKKNINPSIILMDQLAHQQKPSLKAAKIRRKEKGTEGQGTSKIRKRIQKDFTAEDL